MDPQIKALLRAAVPVLWRHFGEVMTMALEFIAALKAAHDDGHPPEKAVQHAISHTDDWLTERNSNPNAGGG